MDCQRARDPERIEAVHVATRRQYGRVTHNVAASRRTNVARIQRAQDCIDFVIAGKRSIDVPQLVHGCKQRARLLAGAPKRDFRRHAGYHSLDGLARWRLAPSFRNREQQVSALSSIWWHANCMQPARNQRAFDLCNPCG